MRERKKPKITQYFSLNGWEDVLAFSLDENTESRVGLGED